MNLSLITACAWVVAATCIGLMPMRFHWPGAIFLMIAAVPLLAWVFWVDGLLIGLVCLFAMGSILRWPTLFLIRKIGRLMGDKKSD